MDQQQPFDNSGAMFPRQKKSPKSADFSGDFSLDADVLSYILDQAKRGGPVKLEISGWKRMGKNNTTFMSLKIQTPYETRGGPPKQQYNQRGNQQGQQQRSFQGRGQSGGYNNQQNQMASDPFGNAPGFDEEIPF